MPSRLALALDAGAIALPDAGRVLLLRPPGDLDLAELTASGLATDRLCAVTGFRPDHDRLAARGVAVADAPEGSFDAAVVFLPRARALGRDLIARAVAAVPEGAPVIVDGAKTDGIDAMLRALRARVDLTSAFAKAHGKCAAFPAPAQLDDWRVRDGGFDGFVTAPGIFSADGVDPGSALLADALPPLSGRVADLGAGWGYLAHRVLVASPEVTTLDLVEAERAALDCARRNVTDGRAAFHWADATTWPEEAGAASCDVVIANPPFHPGRRPDPALGAGFVAAAARLLTPRGRLWMVANRHLPYEEPLDAAFAEVVERRGDNRYKLFEAARPKAARTAARRRA